MIFAAKKTASNNQVSRTDRREDATASAGYVESSPCVVMPAIDLSALIPARFCTPRTIVDYLT